MITDPHDPRQFRRYVQVNADGSVASVHDFEASVEAVPIPNTVEVTELSPFDFSTITIEPSIAQALHAATADLALKTSAVTQAQMAAGKAAAAVLVAAGEARAAISVSAGKPIP